MRNWIWSAIYQLLYTLSGSRRGTRIILLYHSVGGDPPVSVPARTFEQQMEILIKRFKVVRVCDLQETIGTEPPDTNIACVTFDDGYQDNYEVALPILEHMGVKASFFIATGFLEKIFRGSTSEFTMIAPGQVRELAALGHEIGAHTVNHSKLTQIPLETAKAEIEGSRSFLEDLLGNHVTSFAYPKGDCNREVKMLVRQLGFKMGVTIRPDLLNSHPDWFEIPRVWIAGNLSSVEFKAKVSPAMRRYAQLRGRG